MKKYIFIILILMCSISTSYAQQQDYRTVIGEYTFIYAEITQKHVHPLMVTAICKDFDLEKLNKDSLNGFLESLFQNCFFVASIDFERLNFVQKYNIEESEEEASRFIGKFWGMVSELSTEHRLKFSSGERVYINLFNIKGLFWVVNKDNKKVIEADSSRIDIFDLPYIQDCYIPAVISEYSKYKGSVADQGGSNR